jgi:MFS family permease
MQTLAAWINEKGVKIGDDTYKINILTFDDRKDPKQSIAGMEKMAQEGVHVGPNVDDGAAADRPVAEKDNVIYFPYAFPKALYTMPASDAIVGMVANYQSGPAICRYLKENKGVKTIALIGRLCQSLQQNEELASSIGVDVAMLGVIACAVSSFVGGVGGTIFASLSQSIYPSSFAVSDSVNFMLNCFLGGLGFVFGPILGTFVLYFGWDLLFSTGEYQLLIYSSVPIVLMLALPCVGARLHSVNAALAKALPGGGGQGRGGQCARPRRVLSSPRRNPRPRLRKSALAPLVSISP